MNNLIGKNLYRSTNSSPFVYLDDYNPLDKKINLNKVLNHIKTDSEEKDPIIFIGKIVNVEYFVKYALDKDQSIKNKGIIRPDQIYILIQTDKEYFYYLNRFEKYNNQLIFTGCSYTKSEINSGWGGFHRFKIKTFLNKCNYTTNYDGEGGYAVEANAVVPFFDKIYEDRFNKTLNDSKDWMISSLFNDSRIFNYYENDALLAINDEVKLRFEELNNLQKEFIDNFLNIDKASKFMLAV